MRRVGPSGSPENATGASRWLDSLQLIDAPMSCQPPFWGLSYEVGDLFCEVRGAGARQPDGGDNASLAVSEADQPDPIGGPALGAGGAGVDLDGDGGQCDSSSVGCRGRAGCWSCGQDRDGPLGWGGQALIRSHASGSLLLGDGRRIVRRPAGSGSRISGQTVPEKHASVGGRAEVGVDLSGDVALQTADDFHLRLALLAASLDVDESRGM